MKKGFFILSFVLFSAITLSITQGQDIEFYHRTHLLVMFKPGVITLPSGSNQAQPSQVSNLPAWLNNLAASTGLQTIAKSDPAFVPGDTIKIRSDGKRIKTLDFSRIFFLIFPDGLNLDSISEYVKNQNEVIFVDRWPVVELAIIPNDPHFNKQWALTDPVGQDYAIDADSAWDFFKGDSTFKIGILDTGVKRTPLDFGTKVSGDLTIGRVNPALGGRVHGTAVAGVAAAIGNNDTGVAGVDWNAKIFAKNLDTLHWNPVGISNAVIEAVAAGCSVLNNSWVALDSLGRPDTSEFTFVVLGSAFAYAYKNNVVSVAATGNNFAERLLYPARSEGVIAVGATDHTGQKVLYSNWGNHIDVVAPGGVYDKNDTLNVIYTTDTLSDSYRYFNGTSAAAPHVSGLASLLKGYKPTLYNDDIENIIELSAKDLDLAGWDKFTGWGRINAKAAFDSLQIPNTIKTFVSSGGGMVDSAETMSYKFFGVDSVADGGPYDVVRYKVVKSISFDNFYYTTPHVWGVGYTTNGFSPKNPNFGIGFCDTVAGTVTASGCMLKTYVYKVYRTPTDSIYVPTVPENVIFGYTVLGERQLLAATEFNVTSDTGPPNRIKVSWKDCNPNEEGIRLLKKDSAGTFTTIADLPPFNPANCATSSDSLIDTNIKGSETYIYKLEAWTRNQIAPSEETVFAKPREPQLLSAVVQTDPNCGWELGMQSFGEIEPEAFAPPNCYNNLVTLTWQAPDTSIQVASAISEYKIHARGTNGVHETWVNVPGSVTEFTICLRADKTYDLWVHTIDTHGAQSLGSNKITRTTGHSGAIACEIYNPPTKVIIPDDPNEKTQGTPSQFSLTQNYPNPFNLSTLIKYSLPQDAKVQIVIYNILGQKIKNFDLGYQSAGYKSLFWDGMNQSGEAVSSGLYLYRIKAGEFVETKRMTLLK